MARCRHVSALDFAVNGTACTGSTPTVTPAGGTGALTVNPCRPRYLNQGKDPNAGGDHDTLPWKPALLTQANCTC
ncbi:hypothetical protein [Nonomuraea sp. NPDC049784]|uniref:hypothetical protein n=1 Tax=Nonomuraea sp. NPDC049784 TaxID=3154361 RepID=UPI00340E6BF1